VADKRVIRRAAADADVETIIDHYLAVVGTERVLHDMLDLPEWLEGGGSP
jgi:hypothetical protein